MLFHTVLRRRGCRDIDPQKHTCQEKGISMSSIGKRLREERMRLDLSQTALGAIGGVLKQAQINYEKGKRFPDASYLEAASKIGVDVQYIITGQRGTSLTALTKDEEELLTQFRAASLQAKAAAIGALQGAKRVVKTGNQLNINGGNIGIATAGDLVIKGQKKVSLNTPVNQSI